MPTCRIVPQMVPKQGNEAFTKGVPALVSPQTVAYNQACGYVCAAAAVQF